MPKTPRLQRAARFTPQARAQLSLVEHALCPLDSQVSMQTGFRADTWYAYTDVSRNRKKANVRVATLDGLSAHDELYLWGLLGLALAQPDPRPELLATPYWCLRHLGMIDAAGRKGGKQFTLFREAIRRLSGVRYQNDAFYDPVRGEHRQVSFGFLNYSLPFNDDSSRGWRFAWDPIFFEFARATGGALTFDLTLYRKLAPASRRLYLYLKKQFWRQASTGTLELRHLAVEVLGFSQTLKVKYLKHKLSACITELLERQLLILPDGTPDAQALFTKRGKGDYVLQLHRGPAFLKAADSSPIVMESPLTDPLRSIGFDDRTVARLLTSYPHPLLEQWADITLAARERNGDTFFKASPQAYFMDNVQSAAAGRRTPPDWWRELRKQERVQEEQRERQKADLTIEATDDEAAFEEYLRTEAKVAFGQVMEKLCCELRDAGQGEDEARRHADYHARMHFRNRFRREHPQGSAEQGFQSLRSLL